MEISASLNSWREIFSTLLLPITDAWGAFFSEEPLLRTMQFALLGGAGLLVFLVFFTTRDILHRTRSFLYQISCILLVAALPFAGFFLYLLIRPMQTVKEREMEEKISSLLEQVERIQSVPLPLKMMSPRPRINSIALRKPIARREAERPAPALVSA